MTQPIQEPSTQRALSRSTWNENQLYRRPPPRSFGISVFRAYRALDPITVSGDGTTQDVFWDIWENCDETVFEEQTVGDEMTALDILLPGSVVITWTLKPATNPDDTWAMYLTDNEPVFGPNTYTTLHSRGDNGVDALEAMPEQLLQTFSRSYPTMDPFSSGNQFPVRFVFSTGQISGGNINIEFGILDVRWEAADLCVGPIES